MNIYRDYTSEEVETMSSSLGHLLALSQSVNSSLQNDSFEDKKNPTRKGRRGYTKGSHSEIEVSANADWTPNDILIRGVKLLDFIEQRWNLEFESYEQKVELLHLGFVNDGREVSPELDESIVVDIEKKEQHKKMSTTEKQLKFWTSFVEYATQIGRNTDIARRKGRPQNFYDVEIKGDGFYAFLQTNRTNLVGVGIYVFKPGMFEKLESKKNEIEKISGLRIDWYSSRESSSDKRILCWHNVDWDDETNYQNSFDWMIQTFDSYIRALNALDFLRG